MPVDLRQWLIVDLSIVIGPPEMDPDLSSGSANRYQPDRTCKCTVQHYNINFPSEEQDLEQ